uniref:CCN family member 2 n=7 Tax=Neoaves TaxID=3078114 RepID=A0A8C3JSR2_9CHAR
KGERPPRRLTAITRSRLTNLPFLPFLTRLQAGIGRSGAEEEEEDPSRPSSQQAPAAPLRRTRPAGNSPHLSAPQLASPRLPFSSPAPLRRGSPRQTDEPQRHGLRQLRRSPSPRPPQPGKRRHRPSARPPRRHPYPFGRCGAGGGGPPDVPPFSLPSLPLLFSAGQEAQGQECSGQCQCGAGPGPTCPAGVSLVLDGCGCCRVCAKQLGELCTERDPCDHHKGLFCDFGSPANRRIGVCTARDGAPCVFGGMVYRSGESFQSSCKYQCTCLDGAVGCVPLCSMDVRLPSPDCPYPRRVKLPGKCCEEWVCDEAKEQTAVGPALAAYRLEDTYGPDPTMMRANCLVQTTEWSACSKTCGMGISTRVTNDNAFCRLEKQSRLCMVRPCEADLEENIKKGKKCIRTPKISKPVKFELSGCTSVKTYRAKFCGVCTDGRCCTPHRTATLPVEFKCPDGEIMKRKMMFIKTCACHYNCPGDNDIFESLYYRKMYGDMA